MTWMSDVSSREQTEKGTRGKWSVRIKEFTSNMTRWTNVLTFCVIFHKSWGIQRNVRISKMNICASSIQLPLSQSFTPMKSVIECANLYVANGATFMLVRYGADGAVECGHTSTLPKPVSCTRGIDDLTVYVDLHRQPICTVTFAGLMQLGGTVYCVHVYSARQEYAMAETYCISKGGKVVELETIEDRYLLRSFNLSDIYFVGGDDNQVPREFRWKSGDLVEPALFAAGEPDLDMERCLIYDCDKDGLGDYPCFVPAKVVCAVPAQ